MSAATLSDGVLATASANFSLVRGVWTPTALTGGADTDFTIRVHETPPNTWWTGSCADMPPDHRDLQTALLHQMLHGLGVFSLVGADRRITVGGPSVYDTQLRAHGTPAVVNGTLRDADALTVADVPVYNPSTYQYGSSLIHYDADGLMNRAQSRSACVRSLDNASRALLRAVGYDCAPAPPDAPPAPVTAPPVFTPAPVPAPAPTATDAISAPPASAQGDLDMYALVVVASVLLVAAAVARWWRSRARGRATERLSSSSVTIENPVTLALNT